MHIGIQLQWDARESNPAVDRYKRSCITQILASQSPFALVRPADHNTLFVGDMTTGILQKIVALLSIRIVPQTVIKLRNPPTLEFRKETGVNETSNHCGTNHSSVSLGKWHGDVNVEAEPVHACFHAPIISNPYDRSIGRTHFCIFHCGVYLWETDLFL